MGCKIETFLIRDCFCFVMSLSGEVTEDELFSRLQQIKDGPEQQNSSTSAPSTETGEDPVGKRPFFVVFNLLSNSNMICH